MANPILEFLIRAKDDASAVVAGVRSRISAASAPASTDLSAAQKAGRDAVNKMNASLREQAAAAPAASKGIAGLGKTFEIFTASATGVTTALSRMGGIVALVTATAIAAWKFGKMVGLKIREIWDPIEQAKAAWPEMEKFNKFLTESVDKRREIEKVKLQKVADEYGTMADNIERAASEQEKLNAARAGLANAQKDIKLAGVDASERKAILAAGDDPIKQAAARADADVARRTVETQAVIDAATAAEASATERDRLAQERLKLAMGERDTYQAEAEAAVNAKAAVTKLFNDLQNKGLSDEERKEREQKLRVDYESAKAVEQEARKALLKSEIPLRGVAADARASAIDADAARSATVAARKRIEVDVLAQAQGAANVAEVVKLEADARLRADDELQAQRQRNQEELSREDLRLRLENVRQEADTARALEPSARDRLGRAQAEAAQTWTWYKDPAAWQSQLAGERQDAAAQQRFGGDASRLQNKFQWRTTKLSDQEEVVRRVIFAREEEQAARQALIQIEANTRGVAEKLDALLRTGG